MACLSWANLLREGITWQKTCALGEELRVLISTEFLSTGLSSSASFGVTIRVASDDKNSLFKPVDEALYAAKNSGHNKYVSKVKPDGD